MFNPTYCNAIIRGFFVSVCVYVFFVCLFLLCPIICSLNDHNSLWISIKHSFKLMLHSIWHEFCGATGVAYLAS